MLDLKELYQEVILDHHRHPRHYGELKPCTHHAAGHNPLCGDRVDVYVDVADNIIRDIKFQAAGCAISKASASLLTETVLGEDLASIDAKVADFLTLVTGEDDWQPDLEQDGQLAALAGVRSFPARVKCATLAWHALLAVLKGESKTVSTEES